MNLGVTDAIRAAGMRAGIADGRHWVEPAAAGEAALLVLEPGQDVLVLERFRTAEGNPVVLSRDVLPAGLVADRPQVVRELLRRSVYEVLERELGVVIADAFDFSVVRRGPGRRFT